MNRALPFLLAALVLSPQRALADFYSVEGRFQCLEKAGAVCFDAAVPRPFLLTDPPPPPPVAPPATVLTPPPAPAPKPAAALRPAPIDPVLAIAHRIEQEKPAAGDLASLRRAADAGDTRALELLAWCALNGIGMPRDAMAAYRLYGEAAKAGVPHAGENQRLVFERSLTSDEREALLERAARSASAAAPGQDAP
jgi:hypothetical protein